VVSTLAPLGRQRADPGLVAWLDQNVSRLFLPTIVLAELANGVASLRRVGKSGPAAELSNWMSDLENAFGRRIPVFDIAAAHAAGVLLDRARGVGLSPGFADAAIGGIALARRMTLLTRNLRHFGPLGVAASDPFLALPG